MTGGKCSHCRTAMGATASHRQHRPFPAPLGGLEGSLASVACSASREPARAPSRKRQGPLIRAVGTASLRSVSLSMGAGECAGVCLCVRVRPAHLCSPTLFPTHPDCSKRFSPTHPWHRPKKGGGKRAGFSKRKRLHTAAGFLPGGEAGLVSENRARTPGHSHRSEQPRARRTCARSRPLLSPSTAGRRFHPPFQARQVEGGSSRDIYSLGSNGKRRRGLQCHPATALGTCGGRVISRDLWP